MYSNYDFMSEAYASDERFANSTFFAAAVRSAKEQAEHCKDVDPSEINPIPAELICGEVSFNSCGYTACFDAIATDGYLYRFIHTVYEDQGDFYAPPDYIDEVTDWQVI